MGLPNASLSEQSILKLLESIASCVFIVNVAVETVRIGIASLIEMEANHKFNPKIVEAFKMVRSEFEAITKVGAQLC